jgi:hypothetical protein
MIWNPNYFSHSSPFTNSFWLAITLYIIAWLRRYEKFFLSGRCFGSILFSKVGWFQIIQGIVLSFDWRVYGITQAHFYGRLLFRKFVVHVILHICCRWSQRWSRFITLEIVEQFTFLYEFLILKSLDFWVNFISNTLSYIAPSFLNLNSHISITGVKASFIDS